MQGTAQNTAPLGRCAVCLRNAHDVGTFGNAFSSEPVSKEPVSTERKGVGCHGEEIFRVCLFGNGEGGLFRNKEGDQQPQTLGESICTVVRTAATVGGKNAGDELIKSGVQAKASLSAEEEGNDPYDSCNQTLC